MNFDGKQILSTFVKMEEGVPQYYAELADNAPDEKSKALFTRLSLEIVGKASGQSEQGVFRGRD